MAKAKTILLFVKPISEEKSLYINAFDKTNLTGINKKITDKSKIAEMLKIKYITSESKYTAPIQSRSEIQSISNEFKLIKFNNSIKRQIGKLVDKKILQHI